MLISLLLCLNLQAETSTQGQVATPSIAGEERKEQSILQRHHPFYFAYNAHLSKMQVSFKSPLLTDWPVYFGYTQQMFWATNEKSAPFRDNTYNPEFFYRWNIKKDVWLNSIDFGPLSHNSNGKAGEDSRSYNAHYVRFNFEKAGHSWTTRASAQLAYFDSFDPTNKDIQDYVGPLSLNLTFVQLFDGWFDKSEISLLAAPGGKFAQRWDYGGYQLSWSFRLGGVHLVPAFYLQYYRGYAETLVNYAQKVDMFRAGVVF